MIRHGPASGLKDVKASTLHSEKPLVAVRALHLMLLAAVLAMAVYVLDSQQQHLHQLSMEPPTVGHSAASVDNSGMIAAPPRGPVRKRFSTHQHVHAAEHTEPSREAAVEQTQRPPGTVPHASATANYISLPWRTLSHLAKDFSSSRGSSYAAAHSPAYLVSAFLDTRGLQKGKRLQVAIIIAVDKQAHKQDWYCLFEICSPAANGSSHQHFHSRLKVPYMVANNEAFFAYQAATGTCSIPEGLGTAQLIKQQTSSQTPTAQQQQLYVTIVDGAMAVATSSNSTAGAAPSFAGGVDSRAWVRLETIPPLQSAAVFTNTTEGSIAMCTPPIHTDAYAATLFEWAEFARLMGASKVLLYAFNPGPLIKPLIDHYQATGFFAVHEWIIPSSILQDPKQPCKLPFFHPSSSRTQYDSPGCTYHQDNYNIAWWGQVLAVQDCVYRAMVDHHRWVVITDFDEYIVPQKSSTPNWTAMLQQLTELNPGGQPAAEYRFSGVKVCSGCTEYKQQQSRMRHTSSINTGASNLKLNRHTKALTGHAYRAKRAVAAGAPHSCLHPSVGFDHILWSAVMATTPEHWKCIVDPLAVGQASVHGTTQFSPDSLASGKVTVPSNVAVKLHDRVHDIHKAATFATVMLPQLLQQVQANMHAQVAAGTSSNDSNSMLANNVPTALPTSWPNSAAATLCDQCAGPAVIDFSMCNLYGHALWRAVSRVVQEMQQAGVFGVWRNSSAGTGNVYGGYSFGAWAPPK